MPILVECPSCNSEFNVPDSYAGKKGRCRKCSAIVSVPSPPIATVPAPFYIQTRDSDDDMPAYKTSVDDPWYFKAAEVFSWIVFGLASAFLVIWMIYLIGAWMEMAKFNRGGPPDVMAPLLGGLGLAIIESGAFLLVLGVKIGVDIGRSLRMGRGR